MFKLPTRVEDAKKESSQKNSMYSPSRFFEACDEFAATSCSNATLAKGLRDGGGIFHGNSFLDSISGNSDPSYVNPFEKMSKRCAMQSVEHLVSPRKKLLLPGLKIRRSTERTNLPLSKSAADDLFDDNPWTDQIPHSMVYHLIKENKRLKLQVLDLIKKDQGNIVQNNNLQDFATSPIPPLSQKVADAVQYQSNQTLEKSTESRSKDPEQSEGREELELSAKMVFASTILANSFREKVKYGGNQGGRISDTTVTNLLLDSADKQIHLPDTFAQLSPSFHRGFDRIHRGCQTHAYEIDEESLKESSFNEKRVAEMLQATSMLLAKARTQETIMRQRELEAELEDQKRIARAQESMGEVGSSAVMETTALIHMMNEAIYVMQGVVNKRNQAIESANHTAEELSQTAKENKALRQTIKRLEKKDLEAKRVDATNLAKISTLQSKCIALEAALNKLNEEHMNLESIVRSSQNDHAAKIAEQKSMLELEFEQKMTKVRNRSIHEVTEVVNENTALKKQIQLLQKEAEVLRNENMELKTRIDNHDSSENDVLVLSPSKSASVHGVQKDLRALSVK
eukprot:766998-Hanusia_phi.AAC.5